MLEESLQTQIKEHLSLLNEVVRIQATLDDTAASLDMRNFLEEIASLSERVALRFDGSAKLCPSFSLARGEGPTNVAFAAIPLGHELTSFILALLYSGGVYPKISSSTRARIESIDVAFDFETVISLSCQNCPDVVQGLNIISFLNPKVTHLTIDGSLFPSLVEERDIRSVPQVYLNGKPFSSGRITLDELLVKMGVPAIAKPSPQGANKGPFDVLIVGGGPAGASAAVYAARKGLKTGIIVERFGGQMNEAAAIENVISLDRIEGIDLARKLEQNIRCYPIEIFEGARAEKLIPFADGSQPHQLKLQGGRLLSARTIIAASGAHWRELNIPGEAAYRNKGVAFCPHCDGPLYKGKRIAVIGGGNSGVEAAIDLANIAEHVTLLQRGPMLVADRVLQQRLMHEDNIEVFTGASTTEILGDERGVTGLVYRRAGASDTQLPVEGVFVQIGLIPNVEWLRGSVTLTERGEVAVDMHGATSVPGIFAAGDVAATPYKQIIIAMGDGAKAALSAFDYLVRQPQMMESLAASPL